MKKEIFFEDIYKELPVTNQIKIGDKLINVPVKYKTQSIMGFFPISTKKAVDFINNKRLKPAEFSWGKSLLGITLFNHLECPVGPYKEIALSIPVIRDSKIMIPFINILFNNKLKNFGFYSFLLTASTDIGKEHAEKIWGYPFYNKIVKVALEENESAFYISADEQENLKNIFVMSINKSIKEKVIKRDYQTYFFKNGRLIKVGLNTIGIASYSLKRKSGKLKLGNHEISNILQELSIDTEPLETLYYIEAIKIANAPEEM